MRQLRWGRVVAALIVLSVLVAGCSRPVAAPPEPIARTEPAPEAPATTEATEDAGEAEAAPPVTEAPAPTAPPVAAPVEGELGTGTTASAVISPTGIVVPVLERHPDGVVVGTPCGRTAKLSRGTPVDGVVVLDAGHGGREPGAVGPTGLTEKELNLAVTNYARDALHAAGVPVVLTRGGDYRITLEARAKIVNTVKPRAFVSIHYNAEPDGPWPRPGVETYYQIGGSSVAESKRLSGLIFEEVVAAMARYEGVAWVADTDAGAKYRKNSQGDDYYGILRRTQGTPASLAELGFISNAPEEALYRRDDVRRVAGEAVARAILRFLNTNDPGSGFTEPYPRETPAGPGGGSTNCEDPALV